MTGERWPFHIIDVFTCRPLAGNQLAVFEGASGIPEPLLQPLAKEIGFAETAFLYPARAAADARMRIFTPENEIPFAGHPTLGTATLVSRELGKNQIILETGRGPIPVRTERGAGPTMRGTMEQPIPTFTPYLHADALLAALRVNRSTLPVTRYDNGLPHVYVVLDHPDDVASLQPDLGALAQLARDSDDPVVGFNVSAGARSAWKTRMFAPADGVPEDSATGSAAGPLALHLARHHLIDWGAEIVVAQGAEIGRPSTLFACVSGHEGDIEKIEVSGFALAVGGGWFDGALLRAEIGE